MQVANSTKFDRCKLIFHRISHQLWDHINKQSNVPTIWANIGHDSCCWHKHNSSQPPCWFSIRLNKNKKSHAHLYLHTSEPISLDRKEYNHHCTKCHGSIVVPHDWSRKKHESHQIWFAEGKIYSEAGKFLSANKQKKKRKMCVREERNSYRKRYHKGSLRCYEDSATQ